MLETLRARGCTSLLIRGWKPDRMAGTGDRARRPPARDTVAPRLLPHNGNLGAGAAFRAVARNSTAAEVVPIRSRDTGVVGASGAEKFAPFTYACRLRLAHETGCNPGGNLEASES